MRLRRANFTGPPCPPLPALALALLLATRLGLSAQTEPAYPAWWYTQGIVSGTAYNDFAAANQGQAKNITVAAINELDVDLAQFGGAGPALDAFAAQLLSNEANNVPQLNDYAAVNLGQLKNLTQPIYDRLLTLGYYGPPLSTGTAMTSGTYPWLLTSLPANDYAAANIGQLKYLFSFDVTYSTANDGIPDWWLRLYSLPLTTSTSASVPWSGGQVTYLQAYQQGFNPFDYFSSQTPVLTILSGNNWTGPEGGLAPYPLMVSVTNSTGNPLCNAPVTFTVTAGGGTMQRYSNTTPLTTITILSDQNGQVKGFFVLPEVSYNTSQITVTAGAATPVTFNETSDGGGGATYRSPFSPSNVNVTINPDGSADMTWQNNTDPGDQATIPIWAQSPSGWAQVDSVSAGTTSYHYPAPAQ